MPHPPLGLTVLSLALCVPLTAAWGWSYRRGYSREAGHVAVCVNNGVVVYWDADIPAAPPGVRWAGFDAAREPMTADWIEREQGRPFAVRLAGFAFGTFPDTHVGSTEVVAVVPVWSVVLPFALLPLWRPRGRGGGRGFPVVPRPVDGAA